MPIVYVKGDVVKAFENGEIDVLIHQCNAQGVMGSGIAKQIKDSFPDAFKDYKKASPYKLGNCIETWIERPPKRGMIVNLIGQDKYYPRGVKHTSYDAIDEALKYILKCRYLLDDKIGMPKIGAGLGGGNWKVIEAIINSHFGDREVFVYELE